MTMMSYSDRDRKGGSHLLHLLAVALLVTFVPGHNPRRKCKRNPSNGMKCIAFALLCFCLTLTDLPTDPNGTAIPVSSGNLAGGVLMLAFFSIFLFSHQADVPERSIKATQRHPGVSLSTRTALEDELWSRRWFGEYFTRLFKMFHIFCHLFRHL
uniref:Uncharacterized protein n=1 Tax=Anopheles darlingi TaxID=43151 RepID=A0A2M4D3Z8_ANODA